LASDTMDNALSVRLEQNSPIPLSVNFRCEAGELLALFGPSGSGKSTVLRSVAGLYKTPSGQVRCGERLWQNSEQRVFKKARSRSVGLVFQDYALFPHLSALENVLTATHHMQSAERRAAATRCISQSIGTAASSAAVGRAVFVSGSANPFATLP